MRRFFTRSLLMVSVAAAATLLVPQYDSTTAVAQDQPAPAKTGKLPGVEFDIEKKVVRVECEALEVNAPLEFFVCLAGTAEHEAVMRTAAKPSHIHTALLAVGLKPGQPLTFLDATKKWLPPQGPPLQMTVEFMKDGQKVSYPAYRWIRDIKTKKEPRAFTWIFAGSRVTPEGRYGADDTGYIVTLVNFDYAMIDLPDLASNANDLLEFERNADLMPPKGTKVTLVIEPAGKVAGGEAPKVTTPVAPEVANTPPTPKPEVAPAPGAAPAGLSEIAIDEKRVQSMIDYHKSVMSPRQKALKEAAEAHYKVISELRKEQQRLITEADRIQRAIDQLERDWSDTVTPRPEFETEPKEKPEQ